VHGVQKTIILALKYALIASSPRAGISQLTRILDFFFFVSVAEIFKNKIIAAASAAVVNIFISNFAWIDEYFALLIKQINFPPTLFLFFIN